MTYTEISADQIPADLRWDTPRANQGQIVEHSYANPNSAGEAGDGDPYYRILDRSTGTATYYAWTETLATQVGAENVSWGGTDLTPDWSTRPAKQ